MPEADAILDWLLNNKEWLFSGLGVTALLALFLAGRYVLGRGRRDGGLVEPEPAKPSMPFDAADYARHPLPADITADVGGVPPFQVAAKEQSYVDLKVQWRTTLSSAEESENDTVRLTLLDRGSYPWIYCTVKIGEYPEIKIATKGTEIWVAGTIEQVSGNTITLGSPNLRIGEPPSIVKRSVR